MSPILSTSATSAAIASSLPSGSSALGTDLTVASEASPSSSAYVSPAASQEIEPEFSPLHGNLKKFPAWLRHIEFQLKFAERSRKKELSLHFITPAKVKITIHWEPAKRELGLTASLQDRQGVFQPAWKKLLAVDGPMSLLLQSIGRGIGAIEVSPHIASATWRPLNAEEKCWALFQLKQYDFSSKQDITLALRVPEETTPLQWIQAFLESLRETLRV